MASTRQRRNDYAYAGNSTSQRKLSVRFHRLSEDLANSRPFDPNQINHLNLNTSKPKWTGPENIGSPESENGPRCRIALDRFVEKSPDFIGM